MLMTVSIERLDRVKMGKDPATGKRLYASGTVTPADFKAIQKAVLAALGLYRLTNAL